jgi:hypothetical protein
MTKKNISHKVGYVEILKIANKLGVQHDDIKCGRMRQPIYINEHRRKITGTCCLDWRKCHYKYPQKYNDCSRQKLIMGHYEEDDE